MRTIRWGIIGCGNVCEKKSGPALAGVEGQKSTTLLDLASRLPHDGTMAEVDYTRRLR
jgi:predicted dehydrogenase